MSKYLLVWKYDRGSKLARSDFLQNGQRMAVFLLMTSASAQMNFPMSTKTQVHLHSKTLIKRKWSIMQRNQTLFKSMPARKPSQQERNLKQSLLRLSYLQSTLRGPMQGCSNPRYYQWMDSLTCKKTLCMGPCLPQAISTSFDQRGSFISWVILREIRLVFGIRQ
jgi:hypothetical protein